MRRNSEHRLRAGRDEGSCGDKKKCGAIGVGGKLKLCKSGKKEVH